MKERKELYCLVSQVWPLDLEIKILGISTNTGRGFRRYDKMTNVLQWIGYFKEPYPEGIQNIEERII